MSIEVMKKALEALESKYIVNCGAWRLQQDEAITALRQAIAEAEKQEPYGYFRYDIRLDAWVQNRESTQGVAFYPTPPKREWVGLTKEECWELLVAHKEKPFSFLIAVEAKLKEKNT
jgi:hypothetical protein